MKKLLCLVPVFFFLFCQCETQSKLELIAKGVNLKVPVQMDEITTLDSCTAEIGEVLKYHYTMKMDGLEELSIPIFKLYQKKELIKGLQSNEKDVLKMYEVASTIEYAYYHDKKEFVSIQISKDDYLGYGNIEEDDAVYRVLEEVVAVMSEVLPESYETGTLLEIKAVYPRTFVSEVQDSEYIKDNKFDSLEFKKIRMDEHFGALDQNLLSDLIGVDANLNYRYVFRDANDNYLATVESTIADYKASKDVD